jgi:hypothetical protein
MSTGVALASFAKDMSSGMRATPVTGTRLGGTLDMAACGESDRRRWIRRAPLDVLLPYRSLPSW